MSDAVVKALQKKASLSRYEPTFREKASDVLRALLPCWGITSWTA